MISESKKTDQLISSKDRISFPRQLHALNTRLRFLFLGLALAGNMEVSKDTEYNARNPSLFYPDSSATLVASNLDVGEFRKQLKIGSLSLLLNAEGVPTGYALFPENRIHPLSEHQRNQLSDAQNVATEWGAPEPAFVIEKITQSYLSDPTPEQPQITSKPEDVMSAEQLAEHNVTVVNPTSEKEAPQLLLRESLFIGNSVLEPLDVLNQSLPDGEKLELRMVNFNTEFLSEGYLLSLPEYQPYKEMLIDAPNDYDVFLQSRLALMDTKIYEARHLVKRLVASNNPEAEAAKNELGTLQAERMIYSDALAHDEIVNDMILKKNELSNFAVGLYFDAYKDLGDKKAAVFVTAPDRNKKALIEYYTIFVDAEGKISANLTFFNSAPGVKAPSIDNSFPSLQNLERREDSTLENGNYLYKFGDTIGFVSRHEMAHFLLMKVLPELAKKGIIHQSTFARTILDLPEIQEYLEQNNLTAETFPQISSEYLTDVVAAKSIEIAHQRWIESGMTDDSGYGIVYFVKGSNYIPDGYQLTKKQKLPKREEDASAGRSGI